MVRAYKKQRSRIIEELYVDEEYRRKGIGKKLVDAALKFLSKNVLVVLVTTENGLKDAQKFYESRGFKLSDEPWYFIKPKERNLSECKHHTRKT